MIVAPARSAAPVRRGIASRVVESWWAPRRVVAGLRDMPDGALAAVLLAAMLIFWLAQAPLHARAAVLNPSIPLSARMGAAALGVVFLMPLVAYAVAALSDLALRLFRRDITARHARLALFWALLAIAPMMLLSGIVAGMIGPGPALTLTRMVAGVGFLVIWGTGLSALSVRR